MGEPVAAHFPAILSLSPRARGNSETAADLFAAGVAEVSGGDAPVLRLRNHTVGPCLSCHACDKIGACPQEADDDAAALLGALAEAPYVFLSAPIYFYHLPAQAKALIDRSQSWYMRRLAGDPAVTGLPERDAYVCLVAGRKVGDKLFEGSLLTLKYFLKVFNLRMRDPLTLYGIDTAGDLAADGGAREALLAMGRNAALRAGR